jgi:ATP-dependent Clp protease, protease subunit
MAKKIKLNGPVVSGGNSWIYDWLGMETISPKRVLSELDKAAGDDVELYINSGGGSVFAGSEIFTALKEYRGKITSKVTGVAASAATFFVLASDEVYVSPLAQMMIHKAATSTEGDSTAHASGFDLLDGVDRSIAKVYQARTKLKESEILDLMGKTSWMNAEKAVQLGFADGVLFDEESDVSNSLDLTAELPQDVIDKLKNELLRNALRNNPIDNNQTTIDPVNQAMPTNERNDKAMNIEEFKAQHPELYNQVHDLGAKEGEEKGAKNERERIKSIDEIANTVDANLVAKAKYETPITAEALAFQALKADAAKGVKHINDRQEELQANGDVAAGKKPEEVKAAQEAEQINLIAAAANSGRTEAK